jgi:protein tyrosine/serine phosphatase
MTLKNFHQVSGYVYRSDQPAVSDWPELAKLGSPLNVISLRVNGEDGGYSTDAESSVALTAGIGDWVNIPVGEAPWDAPTKYQVQQVMDFLSNGSTWLIHCRRGCDRTGVFVACYRMQIQRWNKAAAIADAKALGMSRWEFRMADFLEDFVVK